MSPRTFGGEFVAQALLAAAATAPAGFACHSLNCYFLRPGDSGSGTRYRVERVRDRGTFATRAVTGSQEGGGAVITLLCSFQAPEEGLRHGRDLPAGAAARLPQPEGLRSLGESYAWHARDPRVLPGFRAYLSGRAAQGFVADFRYIDDGDRVRPEKRAPCQRVWMRAEGRLAGPPGAADHQACLGWLSDFALLDTTLLPHGVPAPSPKLQQASLNHSIYFHAPFRADEWLLHEMASPAAAGGRGLAMGLVYDRAGRHVATVVQEGLIRLTHDGGKKIHRALKHRKLFEAVQPPGGASGEGGGGDPLLMSASPPPGCRMGEEGVRACVRACVRTRKSTRRKV